MQSRGVAAAARFGTHRRKQATRGKPKAPSGASRATRPFSLELVCFHALTYKPSSSLKSFAALNHVSHGLISRVAPGLGRMLSEYLRLT